MRYSSPDEDSARWDGFPFREGDIIISTRSKSGTTWMQMICALLVFQDPELPAPLPELSPWLDWLIVPRDRVYAQLNRQEHRRFIKTHTPLDGIPLDPRATYIVVARHPLDMAVSLFHQGENLNRERMAQLLSEPPGTPVERSPAAPPAEASTAPDPTAPPSIRDSLLAWIDRDVAPADALDSLPGVLWHLTDAWRRRHDPNIVVVHYADLVDDLEGEMRRLAFTLAIDVPEERWPLLVEAAGFTQMRARAERLAPDPAGIMKDRNAFFRRGGSGSGRELLTDDEFAHYEKRAAELAPDDLLTWLHR
ncbi:glycolipid sulfotransferase [Actinoplanes sp. NBRC 14428]|uniref:Sulfotransferase domain-containing protein n=1 Tax=Pseudosporangium ferrugineum TaxID=439699 RepID=A0A2T0S177_9ACTN|nr:sulfotransferase domain-containing protein [Pseudosporangium ferrugineum]PRY27175.1 sulfotransferase domain-containing protein [Pseudosporangium ferrugineum]BCJ53223.1 glycolipid sulfotransferase [Actinoplanes sp. NBRC 14428]